MIKYWKVNCNLQSSRSYVVIAPDEEAAKEEGYNAHIEWCQSDSKASQQLDLEDCVNSAELIQNSKAEIEWAHKLGKRSSKQ